MVDTNRAVMDRCDAGQLSEVLQKTHHVKIPKELTECSCAHVEGWSETTTSKPVNCDGVQFEETVLISFIHPLQVQLRVFKLLLVMKEILISFNNDGELMLIYVCCKKNLINTQLQVIVNKFFLFPTQSAEVSVVIPVIS